MIGRVNRCFYVSPPLDFLLAFTLMLTCILGCFVWSRYWNFASVLMVMLLCFCVRVLLIPGLPVGHRPEDVDLPTWLLWRYCYSAVRM